MSTNNNNNNNSAIGSTYRALAEASKLSIPILSQPDKLGFFCDLYFPIYDKPINGDYNEVDLFATHKNARYSDTPDAKDNFYIIGFLKTQIMNSPNSEFETFYLEGDNDRPYIEAVVELPIATKIVVHFTDSITVSFWVEKKTINQAGIIHMMLNPIV